MTAWSFLRQMASIYHFHSRERPATGRASNSELKRWIQNKALIVNGETVAWDEPMDFPVFSVVLFPKHPLTLI